MKKGKFIQIEDSSNKGYFDELFDVGNMNLKERVKYELDRLGDIENKEWYDIDKRVYSYLRFIRDYLKEYDTDSKQNIDRFNVEEFLNYNAVKRWMYVDWKDVDKDDSYEISKGWSSGELEEDKMRTFYKLKGSNEYADGFYIGKWKEEYKTLTGSDKNISGLDRYIYFDEYDFGKSYISFDVSRFCFDLSKGMFRDEVIYEELKATKGYKYSIQPPTDKTTRDLVFTETYNRKYRFLYWKMNSLKWRNYNQRVMDKLLKEEFILGEYYDSGKVSLRRYDSGYVERRFWKPFDEDNNYVELFVRYGMGKRFELGDDESVLLVENDRDIIRKAILSIYENWVELYGARMEVKWFDKQKSKAYYDFNAVILSRLGYNKRTFDISNVNDDDKSEISNYKINDYLKKLKRRKKEDILNDKFGLLKFSLYSDMKEMNDWNDRERYIEKNYIWNENLRMWVNKSSVKNILNKI